MGLVYNIANDGDTEFLIRKYLKAGAMTLRAGRERNAEPCRAGTWHRCCQTS